VAFFAETLDSEVSLEIQEQAQRVFLLLNEREELRNAYDGHTLENLAWMPKPTRIAGQE
jgi:hypothetical protein